MGPIEYRPFPKGLYNKDGVLKIVQDAAELEAAGPDWQFRPDGKPLEVPAVETEKKTEKKTKDK